MTDKPNVPNQPAPARSGAPSPEEPRLRYTPQLAEEIELRWQDRWAERGTFWAANPSGPLTDGKGRHADPGSPSFFVMDMFPYPSGAGLHVGHPLGYIATDVVGRFRRMCGDNVLHALAFDAFGLPAEQYAVQTGQHPRITTEQNIANMQRQLRRLGLAHDERRSFATTDSEYVRWTQWIFLQIFNSWYDETAVRPDGGTGKARPIAELEAELADGTRPTPDGTPWAEMDAVARRRVIDSYRLAYVSESPVNWCPGLGTVLANEEVTADGRSERGNFPVFQRSLRQWNMRITAYADRLADDLELIDWPDKVKAMQRNWIGRSQGAKVRFDVQGGSEVEVFTTRPDTLFGATFMVVAPEHPLLDEVPAEWPDGTRDAWTGGHENPAAAVAAYRAEAAAKTAVERQADAGRKTGVFTGHLATNPVNGALLPVFTADYVLMGYGTGAIMAVPGGDERDYAFAEAFDVPVIYTVDAPEGTPDGARTGDGAIINSSNDSISLDGLSVPEAKAAMIAWLEERGIGEGTITYRLRDWLFSRQRYWGEPFPIVYDENDLPIAVPDSALPVDLPDVPDYSPRTYDPQDADSSPEPPLGRNEDWVNVTLDLGDGPRQYRRDTNTMPNWAGSCWYYLRYLDPTNADAVVAAELEKYWLGPDHNATAGAAGGVDLYVGGVEHAVLHLLYARFWHKVLFDLGHVSGSEPFHKLFNQGYIQAYAYTDERGAYVPAAEVTETTGADGQTEYRYQGELVNREYGKMGKSLKNIVTPDEMYDAFGADTFRVYEMSMGPLDLSRPWEDACRRRLAALPAAPVAQRRRRDDRRRHRDGRRARRRDAARAAPRDRRRAHRDGGDAPQHGDRQAHHAQQPPHEPARGPRVAAEAIVLMTAPVAPHIAEELWERLGHTESLAYEPFPVADEAYLVEDTVTCVVQVQGKVRARLEVSPSISDADLEAAALAEPALVRFLDGRPVRKVIVKAPKLVNVVI